MTLSEFQRIPLLRSFISVDLKTGVMLYTQVRRCPDTGLTLKLTTTPKAD